MSKYDPLQHYLAGRAQGLWTASFADIEDTLGALLPSSAYKYQAWWANETQAGSHPQSHAWVIPGWKTTDLDLERRRVTFVRG